MKSPQAPKALGLSSSRQQCRLVGGALSTGALITVLLLSTFIYCHSPAKKGKQVPADAAIHHE